MKEGRSRTLALTRNLIMLERGRQELLLANSFFFHPLYIKKGRPYIKKFLQAVQDLAVPEKIIQAFPQDRQLLQSLEDHRIIIDPRNDKDKFASADIASMTQDLTGSKKISVFLLLAQSCNLNCIYCLNGIRTYQTGKKLKMREEVAYKALDVSLEKLTSGDTLEIVFFGGEPLLNWPLAKKIILYCENILKPQNKEIKYIYHLTSNLTFLPPDLISWAQKYSISILCNIDGPDFLHDRCRPHLDDSPSHAQVVSHVARLRDAGVVVGARSTIISINQDHMLEIARHHKEMGCVDSAFVPVNPIDSDENILPQSLIPSARKIIKGLVDTYKQRIWDSSDLYPFGLYQHNLQPGTRVVFGCSAPYGHTPVVDVNGKVYPCIYLVGQPRFYLGNIMEKNFPKQQVLNRLMNFLHVDRLEDCQGCAWRYLCGGGCAVWRLTVAQHPQVTTKVLNYCRQISCDVSKKVLELLLWEKAEHAAAAVFKEATSAPTSTLRNPIVC